MLAVDVSSMYFVFKILIFCFVSLVTAAAFKRMREVLSR